MADSTPTQVVQNQVGFAPELAPYAQTLLGNVQALTDTTQNPYQAYTGDRFAQFTPLQKQAFEGAQQMQPAYQLAGATGIAGLAGQQALGTSYTPTNYQAQSILGNQGGYGGMGMSPPGVRPTYGRRYEDAFGQGDGMQLFGSADAQAFGDKMNAGSIRVGSPSDGQPQPQSTLQQYMSPYMQNVVAVQSQQAKRQADIAAQTQQAQAARSGAFGGGRDAVMRSMGNAELQRNLANIQATGSQNAYTQALAQFNTEQQARQQAAQLQEQSRQYGAGLGMQGLQTALTGANTLGTLGQNQYQQTMDINKLQNTYGGQQQSQMQNILGAQYQNYLDQLNYPYKQMGFMSDILRGAPLSQTGSNVFNAPPSTISQLVGAGTALAGATKAFGAKKGGSTKDIQKRGAGLADLALYRMA